MNSERFLRGTSRTDQTEVATQLNHSVTNCWHGTRSTTAALLQAPVENTVRVRSLPFPNVLYNPTFLISSARELLRGEIGKQDRIHLAWILTKLKLLRVTIRSVPLIFYTVPINKWVIVTFTPNLLKNKLLDQKWWLNCLLKGNSWPNHSPF